MKDGIQSLAEDQGAETKWFEAKPSGRQTAAPGDISEAGHPRSAASSDEFARDIIRLWFSLRRWGWSSLAIVPAQPGGSSLALARRLCAVGSAQLGAPVDLIDASDLDLRDGPRQIDWMKGRVSSGGLVIVAMTSVLDQPAGVPVASAADACLLLVTKEETRLDSARSTLELVGRERFIGAVAGKSSAVSSSRGTT